MSGTREHAAELGGQEVAIRLTLGALDGEALGQQGSFQCFVAAE